MSFRFEIIRINTLTRARIAVLDGRLLEGSVTTDISAELIHAEQRFPIHIKGVVLGSVCPGTDVLSLTVDLHQETMGLVAVGDLIVSTG